MSNLKTETYNVRWNDSIPESKIEKVWEYWTNLRKEIAKLYPYVPHTFRSEKRVYDDRVLISIELSKTPARAEVWFHAFPEDHLQYAEFVYEDLSGRISFDVTEDNIVRMLWKEVLKRVKE